MQRTISFPGINENEQRKGKNWSRDITFEEFPVNDRWLYVEAHSPAVIFRITLANGVQNPFLIYKLCCITSLSFWVTPRQVNKNLLWLLNAFLMKPVMPTRLRTRLSRHQPFLIALSSMKQHSDCFSWSAELPKKNLKKKNESSFSLCIGWTNLTQNRGMSGVLKLDYQAEHNHCFQSLCCMQ